MLVPAFIQFDGKMMNAGNKGLPLPYHACMKLDAIKKPSGKLAGETEKVKLAIMFIEFKLLKKN